MIGQSDVYDDVLGHASITKTIRNKRRDDDDENAPFLMKMELSQEQLQPLDWASSIRHSVVLCQQERFWLVQIPISTYHTNSKYTLLSQHQIEEKVLFLLPSHVLPLDRSPILDLVPQSSTSRKETISY